VTHRSSGQTLELQLQGQKEKHVHTELTGVHIHAITYQIIV